MFYTDTNTDINKKALRRIRQSSKPERLTGYLAETRGVHWNWDHAGRN